MQTKRHDSRHRTTNAWAMMREAEASVADEDAGYQPHSRRHGAVEQFAWCAVGSGKRRSVMATGATHPETGEALQDRETGTRW